MNRSGRQHSNTAETKVQVKQGGFFYALSQYVTMLQRWGMKCLGFAQNYLLYFGFQSVIMLGKYKINIAIYKSYSHIYKLKSEVGPMTVHGGSRDDF
jgi:hypothetical protein